MLAWKLKLFNVPGMLLSRFLSADMPPHAKRESGSFAERGKWSWGAL